MDSDGVLSTVLKTVNGYSPDGNGDIKIEIDCGDKFPVGSIQLMACNEIPTGWLECNGQEVSRTEFPSLFAKIGTLWGEGDGSTTFNLPNLIGRFPEGSNVAGTIKSAGLPNITGKVLEYGNQWKSASGAFNLNGSGSGYTHNGTNAGGMTGFNIDASRSSSIYGNSDTVQPNSATFRFCIKATDTVLTDSSVNIDEISSAITATVNARVNETIQSMLGTSKFVVETWKSGSSWYRKWSDGWIEQGGSWTGSTGTTITLPLSFSDTDWTLAFANWGGTAYAYKSGTNQVVMHDVENANSNGYSWYCCGY